MKIVYATYLDHQEKIQYPINFIKKQNPDMLVYCSDRENKEYLRGQGVESIICGIKIVNPGSIATAQNVCLEDAFKRTEADYVVWVQADTYITEEGYRIIKKACIPGNEDKSFALNVKHIRLFHICQSDYYGVTIFGKNHKGRFVLDGAWTTHTGDVADSRLGSECCTIDIGYITIEQCKRHLKQHKKTWGNSNNFLIRVERDELTDKEFVHGYLKMCNVFSVIQEGDIYHKLITEMGLVDEFIKTRELAFDGVFSQFGLLVYY